MPRDAQLTSRPFVVPTNAKLNFWHTYQTESSADGAVIEISIDGGAHFSDLDSRISFGGYNGIINNGTLSAINQQRAWTGGTLGAMTQVVVDLTPYVGDTAIIRFRMVSDDGTGGSGWYIDDIAVIQDSSTTITKTIATGNDDARQVVSTLNLTATTTYLGRATTETNSYTGFRFIGLAIPHGAVIKQAYLRVYSTASQSPATSVVFYADNSANSLAFSTSNLISSRVSTTASYTANITGTWASGQWYSLPDISAVVQEIVNRSDWTSGNSMSIIAANVGLTANRRVFRTYNGAAAQAPQLVVVYE